jgi:thiamine biosynthesis lipoprotein ApbE
MRGPGQGLGWARDQGPNRILHQGRRRGLGHGLSRFLSLSLALAVLDPAVTAARAPAQAAGAPAPGAPVPGAQAPSAPAQAPAAPAQAPGLPPQATAAPARAAGGPLPLRGALPAFGLQAEIEVRDLPKPEAEAALKAALAEIAGIERLTDAARPDSAVSVLNAAAGQGAKPVEPSLLAALARTVDFCFWSDNRNGPLGAELYKVWGLRQPGQRETHLAQPPSGEAMERAARLAACERLSVDLPKGTATLAAGSAIDLSGFALGLAVDRAADVLQKHGVKNGCVRVGNVWRGFGGGEDGKGWWVTLPQVPGAEGPADRVRLRDQALAVAARDDHPLHVADETLSPYLNQRLGRPAEGVAVLATIAVIDLAIDAQALAVTLTIVGSRQGELMMGSIRPRPSILWLQGNGSGPPLAVDYRWAEVPKR